MIEIAGAQFFPLAFERKDAAREVVLLGMIPIGMILQLPTGRYAWSLDLPMVPRAMQGARTRDGACERITHTLRQWFEAAASPSAQSDARARA